MRVPFLLQWMKQGRLFAGLGVNCSKPVSFMQTAIRTLEDQIMLSSQTAFASRDHMIDVEDGPVAKLMQAAISTSPAVAGCNKLAQRTWNRRAAHAGVPRSAMARICANCDIFTRSSNWARSVALNAPSVLRSSNSCMRSFKSLASVGISRAKSRGIVRVSDSSSCVILNSIGHEARPRCGVLRRRDLRVNWTHSGSRAFFSCSDDRSDEISYRSRRVGQTWS